MNVIQKALWFIESHSHEVLVLNDIANACHVSAFHLTRTFAEITGMPLMRYTRARRLTAAAHILANGASDILQVALNAGYGSHEAFTRAFREQFTLTPEAVRARGHVNGLNLTEEFVMNSMSSIELASPRFDIRPTIQLVGLVMPYNRSRLGGIPKQWQQFEPYIGNIAKQVGCVTYGVCFNNDDDDTGNFDYMCAVEVSDARVVPKGMQALSLDEQYCAVFRHEGHISGLPDTFAAIWSSWLPNSAYQLVPSPVVERYNERFDGCTGLGGVEIWLPVVQV